MDVPSLINLGMYSTVNVSVWVTENGMWTASMQKHHAPCLFVTYCTRKWMIWALCLYCALMHPWWHVVDDLGYIRLANFIAKRGEQWIVGCPSYTLGMCLHSAFCNSSNCQVLRAGVDRGLSVWACILLFAEVLFEKSRNNVRIKHAQPDARTHSARTHCSHDDAQ